MSQRVDHTLLAELFDRHAAALALYARQWTATADDCVQESLIELARLAEAPENPTAWLFRVVKHRALNALRGERRRLNREQAAAEIRTETAGGRSAEMSADLADSLAALESQDREIVILRIWGQLSWQEIAEVVGGSKSAAQRRYVNSLELLRKQWTNESCEKN